MKAHYGQDRQGVDKEINTWKGQMICKMEVVNFPKSPTSQSGAAPIKPQEVDGSEIGRRNIHFGSEKVVIGEIITRYNYFSQLTANYL